MSLVIDVTPELEARLREEAEKRGLASPDYARMLLEEQLMATRGASKEKLPFYATATPEEWEKAFQAWIERHGITAPPLPPDALRRESIYGDRG